MDGGGAAPDGVEGGELLWANAAGSAGFDSGSDVTALSDGTLGVVGSFSETAIFGAGGANETALVSLGSRDLFIAKYDMDGELLWVRHAGGPGLEEAGKLAEMDDGSLVICGGAEDGAVFGAGETHEFVVDTRGGTDMLIAAFDPNGFLEWVRTEGSSGGDHASSIALSPTGSVLVTGHTSGSPGETVVFGVGEAHETSWQHGDDGRDAVIARFDGNGGLEWVWGSGSHGNDYGRAVAFLSDGSLAATGVYGASFALGGGEPGEAVLPWSGEADVYVARFDPDRHLAWARRIASQSWDYSAGALGVFADDSVIVAGSFGNGVTDPIAATFGEGESNETTLTSEGNGDVFVARFDAEGGLTWARRAGGQELEIVKGVAVGDQGQVWITGSFWGQPTFGAGEATEMTLADVGQRPSNLFIARYTSDGQFHWARRAGTTDEASPEPDDQGTAIVELPDGSLVITGQCGESATFGPGEPNETTLTPHGGRDIFLARFEP